MKNIIYLLGMLAITGVGCKKQSASTLSSLGGIYTWSGIDTAIVVSDTNGHFDTSVMAVADTPFSVQVLNDSVVIVDYLTPITTFAGQVLYNQLALVATNPGTQTMTFYASGNTAYNVYSVSPNGHVATVTEYLTYNYGNHSLTYDYYMTDDLKEQWNLHLHSTGK